MEATKLAVTIVLAPFCMLFGLGCGNGELRDCDAACKRYFKCCEGFICDGPPYAMEDCMSMCESANKITNADALKDLDKCYGIPCDESDRFEECRLQAIQHCTDLNSKAIEDVCNRDFECVIDPYPSIEKCQELVGLNFMCFTKQAVDAYLSCSQTSACETYQEDRSDCFKDEMDISWYGPWYAL